MIKRLPLILPLIGLFVLIGCSLSSTTDYVQHSSALAQWILRSPSIKLATRHVSGVKDRATPRHNVTYAAARVPAMRSSYGNAPGGSVYLDSRMLSGLKRLVMEGYTMNITSLAGASHSPNSRHYLGVAADINYINGVKVNYANPYYRRFMARARALGATEVLGPGDRAHSGHVHIAWPRTDGQ